MTYTFYICNNEAAMNRLPSGNTFEIHEESFETDQEAYKYALDLIDCMAEDEDELSDLDKLYDQDAGAGDPICYKIECDGEEIFDFNSDYWEALRKKYDPDILEDVNKPRYEVVKHGQYLYAIMDNKKGLLARKPQYMNDPEAYKYGYGPDGKAYFFISKSKEDAQKYADELNSKESIIESEVESEKAEDSRIEYKGHTIERFEYEWNIEGQPKQHIKSYIILSPSYFKKGEEKYYLPLYCEDETGKVQEFASVDEAKAWIDKYEGRYELKVKNSDEIHAVIKDSPDKLIKELEAEREQVENALDRKSDQGVDFSSESEELDRIDAEIKRIKSENGITESLENVGDNLYARINNAIKGELDAIDIYNDLIVYCEVEQRSDLAKLMNDIANEEKVHMGELQKALESIDPQYGIKHSEGEVEAEQELDPKIQESLDKLLEYYHYEPEDVDLEYDDKQELIKDWIASADKDSLIEAISEVDGDYQAFKEYLEEEQLTEETITIEQVREFLEDTSTALDKEIFDNWVDDDAKYEKRCEIAQSATEAAQDEEDIRRQYYSDRI